MYNMYVWDTYLSFFLIRISCSVQSEAAFYTQLVLARITDRHADHIFLHISE